jgi:hypothetical protein
VSKRSGIDLYRADLHDLFELAGRHPIALHRSGPRREFQIEYDGLWHRISAPNLRKAGTLGTNHRIPRD